MSGSEVAKLLKEIELSYQAAQRGLSGFAEGTAKHEFITKKMENIESGRVALAAIVGSDNAMQLIAQTLENAEVEKNDSYSV